MATETKSSMSGISHPGTADGTEWTGGGMADFSCTVSGNSQVLRISNFGFDLTDCTAINDITLSLHRHGSAQDSADDRPQNLAIQLYSDGLGLSSDKAAENLVWDGEETVDFSAGADLWGYTIADFDDVRDASFGVRISVTNEGLAPGGGLVGALVKGVSITIDFETTGAGPDPALLDWSIEDNPSLYVRSKRLVSVK